jgi:hypothetical protein
MPRSHASAFTLFAFFTGSLLTSLQGEVERVWLTHQSSDPERIVVSWESSAAGPSVVHFGPTPQLGAVMEIAGHRTLHHVEIPATGRHAMIHYTAGDGVVQTPVFSFKTPPEDELRVAVVGDWGFAKGKDLPALMKDDVHLLVTAGDNVAGLHEKGCEGTKAFSALIDRHPALFRSTPLLPILGNHDREIRPRGPRPPAEPVYDVAATAYRQFFALPGPEWRWHFDLPDFDLRLIALDLNHLTDHGTTWQTCQAWGPESEQYLWYRKLMEEPTPGYVITLMNEKQTTVDSAAKGIWHEAFRRGSALITGFGYFAERAELEGGLPYFNTCLKGDGSPYKDPSSAFFARTDNYLLLTFNKRADTMKVQFKSLQGEVLDTREIKRR